MAKKGACDICTEADSADDMVCCDLCEVWLHYGCAGVDDSVKSCKWFCLKCKSDLTRSMKAIRNISPAKSAPIVAGLVVDVTSVPRSGRSGGSALSKQMLDLELLRLEEQKTLEQRLFEERERKQQEYLTKKYELLKLRQQHEENSGTSRGDGCSGDIPHRVSANDVVSVVRRTKDWLAHAGMGTQADKSKDTLTINQMASRKSVSRELPFFSGKSDEWPIFISCYRNSTALCNFSNDENLIRLQKALKGKAFQAVSSQLLLPESVPAVLSTLEMLFGRPEYIVEDLIRKVEIFPAPRIERLETIISYALAVKNLSSTMEASEMTDHMNNPVLLKKLVDKLPSAMKLEWAMGLQTSDLENNIRGFGEWIYKRAEAAAVVTRYADDGNKVDKRSGHVHTHVQADNVSEVACAKEGSGLKCYVCGQSHRLIDCDAFKNLSVKDRQKLVAEKAICICLRHAKRIRCKKMKECGIAGCRLKHHRLLHSEDSKEVGACHSHQNEKEMGTLFRILPVVLHGKEKDVNTFAFLDSGSSITLLEESIAKKLNLEGTPKPLCLRWTANSTRREEGSEVVSLSISANGVDKERYPSVRLNGVRTVKSLALPSQSLSQDLIEKFNHFKGLPLSPYDKAECGILIGLNNEKAAVALKVREGRWNEPIALKTRLGWCISGGSESNYQSYGNFQICECEEDIHELVKRHFALEDSGITQVRTDSKDDLRAKDILAATTKRVDGSFECGLLWRHDDFCMPNSYHMALKRLCCLEKKVRYNPMVISNINQQVASLVQKGYARRCNRDEVDSLSSKTWYLPTFIVTNPNKPGKIRLVWDAAASANGVSLNKMLLKGPDQLKELPEVLFGFRSNKVAITGDIEEMFHQIRVRKDDQCAQRFLWRDGEDNRKPDIYQMEVLTFGASCSPSIALYVKDINAAEFSEKYPRAVESILEHHYMDDLLDSVSTVAEAVHLAKEVREIHSKAGFRMRGWMSNSSEVLQSLGESIESENRIIDCGNENNIAKVLGLWWLPKDDIFTFFLKFIKTHEDVLSGSRLPTKRELLRILMSIFDPLGFLAFYLVRIKVLLQDVWRQKLEWDDYIQGSLATKWESWRRLLSNVGHVRIPRCYNTLLMKDGVSVQLHIFMDASEDAFAAVSYLRFCDGFSTECTLVGAKNKVTPLLPVSIPRLELQAALLGTRLAKTIVEGHGFSIDRKFFWTDSKTVLHWLRSDAKMYKPFVMFRIGEIQEKTKIDDWRWIPTKLNVADEATKWAKEPCFDSNSRWFAAPVFLQQPEEFWPEEVTCNQNVVCEEELRAKYVMVMRENVSRMEKGIQTLIIDFNRFSTWERLHKVVSWIVRYCQNLRRKVQARSEEPNRITLEPSSIDFASGPIRSEEMRRAEIILWRMAQWADFADELAMLKNGDQIPKTSEIRKLNPCIDDNGIMRLEGRINYADFVDEETRRPVLLSRKNRVSFLIVDFYHRQFKHLCDATVYNEVRQRYFIPALRTLVRSVRTQCARCRVKDATPRIPQMAQLPRARLGPFKRPFTFVGVDYFGPILVVQGRSQVKRWGVLFTCLTSRAIHIEVAFSLSTDSCILSIQRFIARRGTPSEFYSDNGTNFVGAEKELREQFQLINKKVLISKLTSPVTKWFFNPPAAPHMGGSWERLIGTVKKILKEVMENKRLNDETFQSALVEIEAVVNSRPLTYVTLGPEDEEALTPNHFIFGSSNGNKGLVEYNDRELMSRKDWRKVQQVANVFWKRWVREYLPTLTKRTKWFEKVEPVKKGDVVLIIDENMPRCTWPKGIIISTITSKDGQVRRATVKTASGIFDRPVAKLALLNISQITESKADCGAPLLGGEMLLM